MSLDSREPFHRSAGPHAARAQVLRNAALVAIARREAAARRRRAQRSWGLALLIAAGSVAAVFQSCAGSRSAAAKSGEETPLVAKLNPGKIPRTHKPKSVPDRPETTDPEAAARSTFDQAATDVKAMFELMNKGGQEASAAPDEPLPDSPDAQPLTTNVPSLNRRAVDRTYAFNNPTTPGSDLVGPQSTGAPIASIDRDSRSQAASQVIPDAPVLIGPPEPDRPMTAAIPQDSDTSTALAFGAVALCSRVDGFGRFTPLDPRGGSGQAGPIRFLGGRANPAIVYCELDHFTQAPGSGLSFESSGAADGFASEFTTRVELFHDDGSRQWRATEATIRDHTRTRRRDLYLVQRIDLPPNLSVGKYNLKISVRDRLADTTAGAAGAECETILPIEIVADARLLNDLTAPGKLSAPRPIARAPVAGPEPATR